jgi:CDGSH-type Zn-finger protein
MTSKKGARIKVILGGPYLVEGDVPLVRKTQIVSEFGEPLNWRKDADLKGGESYELCRCGHSNDKPYCDGTHCDFDFDGSETAPTNTFAERARVDERGMGIVVKSDHALCMDSGFCGNRLTSIRKMIPDTAEPKIRAEIMAMIDRCPSGTFTYAMDKESPDVEADLPLQIADTSEITQYGPIQGPLWVTGNILIERADGQPFETRNRVTLCNCGQSCKKPLCDGTHRHQQEEALRQAQQNNPPE